MNVVLAGATGFLGKTLTDMLCESHARVTILTRSVAKIPAHHSSCITAVRWDGEHQGEWSHALEGADAVINLAGAPLAAKRWTMDRKRTLLSSRVHSTRALVEAMRLLSSRPPVLVNASAVGYYDSEEDAPATEDAGPGKGFLGETCVHWENEALAAGALGVRVVLLRTGIVLGTGGGALPRLVLPFRLFAGGPIGPGTQWVPWIHQDDVVGAVRHILERKELHGPVNLVAPETVTNAGFSAELARVLRRPSWISVPAPLLRLVLGEMATMVLEGRRVIPVRLHESGYTFSYPQLRQALQSLLT